MNIVKLNFIRNNKNINHETKQLLIFTEATCI